MSLTSTLRIIIFAICACFLLSCGKSEPTTLGVGNISGKAIIVCKIDGIKSSHPILLKRYDDNASSSSTMWNNPIILDPPITITWYNEDEPDNVRTQIIDCIYFPNGAIVIDSDNSFSLEDQSLFLIFHDSEVSAVCFTEEQRNMEWLSEFEMAKKIIRTK